MDSFLFFTFSSCFKQGLNLIRLHKRAVSRFISVDVNSSADDEIKYLFEIWLSYANAQARFGSIDAARTTFRHIQHRRIGEKEAKFYIALADFEIKRQDEIKNREMAKKVIMDGIEKGAEPKQQLIHYLERLNMEGGNEISSSNEENVIILEPQSVQMERVGSGLSWVHVDSSSRCGVEHCTQSSDHTPPITGALKDCSLLESNQSDKSILIDNGVCHIKESQGVAHTTDGEKCANVNKGSILEKSSYPLSTLSKRRKLGVTRPSRSAFGGGATRISALSEMDKTVDEDDDEQDEPNSDISYLLNWTPSGPSTEAAKKAVLEQRATKRKQAIVANEGPTKVSRSNFQFQPVMDVIEETCKDHNSSNSGSNHSNPSLSREQNSASCFSNNLKHDSSGEVTNGIDRKYSGGFLCAAANKCAEDIATNYQSEITCNIISEKNANESKTNFENDEKHVNGNESPSITQSASEVSVHPDFLKIVCEKNILYVNNIPYVKLGVIGKGGSCKVYRTLSRDRNIVAIKKVKIAGMARKSIEGYANEIALLRRLRGNPAIIQLYDSEVDFQRKAIYLVMEPGEVDLNYVVRFCILLL